MSNLIENDNKDDDITDDQESDNDDMTCPICGGEGQVLSQHGDDENERDFENCPTCHGIGTVDPEITRNVEDGDDYSDIEGRKDRPRFD